MCGHAPSFPTFALRIFPLARADGSDPSAANLQLVFYCLIALGVTAFLGFLVVRTARLRCPHRVEAFAAFSVLWVALAAGTAMHDVVVQSKWSRESQERIRSGYYLPAEVEADAPSHPWGLFATVAAGYAALWIAVTLVHRQDAPP